jgi:hypothetical protein
LALANDGIVPELVHAISILNHFVGVDAAGNAIRFALQNRMEYRNAISCLIKAKMMEKNGHLLVDSKLIEDYQMSSPVSANGQIAATRWKGKPAFFSIGSDSDVYFTFRDPDQPAGWREEKLGLKAKLIAATWSEATGPLLFSYDDVYSKDPAYGSDSLRWIHLCWKPETESKWLVQKLAYGFDCKKLVARTLNGEVYLSCVGMDPKVQGDQPYQVSSTRFVGFSTGFRAAAILTDSLNFDFGRNAKGEVGLYILFSPRAYFQSPTACEKVFQDEGNKGTAKNQNLMMWRPKTTGTQKVFGYFAEGGTYHDAPPKYSHGNIRLVAQVLEDPSNSGLLPPVAKKITAWKKVYDTHNTTTSNHMDFSLLQPDLDAAALKDYVPLGCIGLKNMDPSAKDYPEVYALHQDHAVQGTFYDLKTEENGTIYVYSDNQEAGNKLDIWYTGNCEPDKSKGKKCTSVSHILPRYGVSGLDIGGFWARKGIDDVPTNLQNAAYCPAAQPPKKSILLFTPMSASGYFELGQRWEALNLNGHFEGLSLAVLNREGKASELFVCTADGSLCKVSEPDSKGIRQLKAVPVHKKVAFLECQVEQGNIGGYHLFGITKDRHLFQTAVATGDAPGTMLPLFEQDERVSGFDTFLDADGNCGAFSLLQQPESHAMQFLLHDGHSGNWTIQPLHASNANPVLQEIRAFSVQITALDPDDFPWANRNLRIWTEESALIKVNGKSFYAGPNDPVSMKTGQDGRCRISVPTNTLFAPVIHVHADFMDTGDEFVTISPNADLQLKLKNLERDGGLAAAKKNPLHGNPEPLFGSEQANNLDQVGKYLSESMKLLPAIDYAADLRYLRLNREIPDQPNPKTAAARKPKKFGRLSPTPNMRFGLKFENGRATFLQGEETLSPNAMAKSATEWFEGAWGDVWHFVKQAGTAIQDGFLIVIDTLTDGFVRR